MHVEICHFRCHKSLLSGMTDSMHRVAITRNAVNIEDTPINRTKSKVFRLFSAKSRRKDAFIVYRPVQWRWHARALTKPLLSDTCFAMTFDVIRQTTYPEPLAQS